MYESFKVDNPLQRYITVYFMSWYLFRRLLFGIMLFVLQGKTVWL